MAGASEMIGGIRGERAGVGASRDAIHGVLASMAAYAPAELVIREKHRETLTPMAFTYAYDDQDDAESDSADGAATSRRPQLSLDDAASVLTEGTEELDADDILEAAEALPVAPTPRSLETKPASYASYASYPAPPTTRQAVPPKPDSTPTVRQQASPSPTTRPDSGVPSTMPTVIAPRSLGVRSRRDAELVRDAPATTKRARQPWSPSSSSSIDALDALDALHSLESDASHGPPGPRPPRDQAPTTRPYPLPERVSEAEPITVTQGAADPASLPIPLTILSPFATAASDLDAPSSVPVPLARLIESSVSVHERPTLESAEPVAIAPPPVGRFEGLHTIPSATQSAVRPLVLVDMSAAFPQQPARAGRGSVIPSAPNARASLGTAASAVGVGLTASWSLLFAAGAAFVAAAVIVVSVLALRNDAANEAARSSVTSSSRFASDRPFRPSQRTQSPTTSAAAAEPAVTAAQSLAPPLVSDGIPVLDVSQLPRADVPSKLGVLHVGPELDGHRIFVDGVVLRDGRGADERHEAEGGGRDFELACGRHIVRVGAQDRARALSVPCGGRISP